MTSAAASGADSKEIAAVYVAIDELKPWADNPRKNAAAVPKVMESISRFGFGAPIVARRADGMVIAGHTRLLAAKALGLDRVPVRFLDLDAVDARLLALADNKVSEIATWDDELLQGVIGQFDTEGIEALSAIGFDDDDLLAMLGLDNELPPEPGDDSDGDPQLGDLKFSIVVEVEDEDAQAALLEELEERGLVCRALML